MNEANRWKQIKRVSITSESKLYMMLVFGDGIGWRKKNKKKLDAT